MEKSGKPGFSLFSGKTALVTGAGRRIGRAVAESLAARGAGVLVHYRSSRSGAEETAAAARELGAEAWTIEADLGDSQEAGRLVTRAVEKAARPIDYLVNNASIYSESRLADLTPDDLNDNVQVNALAPLLLSRSFAEQDLDGVIVNLLDTRITDYDRKHVAYHLSKRMLYSLTRLMAIEFAPRVRVNAVAPGLILPPAGEDEDYLRRLAPTTLLNRPGCLNDVTEAVRFLLESDFVTGQVVYVDGGRHLKGSVYG